MGKQLGERAIVAGGGFGGLCAAAALAPYFRETLVLDRDEAPSGSTVRNGVGQGAHTHTLLKGGEDALEKLLPGFTEGLYRAGGAKMLAGKDLLFFDFAGMMPEFDGGFTLTALSRPLYEKVLREQVEKLPGVSVKFGVDIRRFLVEDGVCKGVELESGEKLAADMVVDAVGMNAPLAEEMMKDGHADFDTQSLKINVAYSTAKFRQPPKYKGERKGFFVLPGPPSPYFGLMLPIEDDQWTVSLGGRGANVPPREPGAFREYASKYPTSDIYDRIKDAEPTSDFRLFRKTFATRRRFHEARKWPERLIAIGDSMSSVNPTYGQGMSVAALQAQELANQLGGRASLEGIGKDYMAPAFAIAERAWNLATSSDYVYPETEGERPPTFEMIRTMAAVLRKLAQDDPEFRVYRLRMGHMLESDARLKDGGPLSQRFFMALQGSMAPPA